MMSSATMILEDDMLSLSRRGTTTSVSYSPALWRLAGAFTFVLLFLVTGVARTALAVPAADSDTWGSIALSWPLHLMLCAVAAWTVVQLIKSSPRGPRRQRTIWVPEEIQDATTAALHQVRRMTPGIKRNIFISQIETILQVVRTGYECTGHTDDPRGQQQLLWWAQERLGLVENDADYHATHDTSS